MNADCLAIASPVSPSALTRVENVAMSNIVTNRLPAMRAANSNAAAAVQDDPFDSPVVAALATMERPYQQQQGQQAQQRRRARRSQLSLRPHSLASLSDRSGTFDATTSVHSQLAALRRRTVSSSSGIGSGDWRPSKYRRFLLRRTNVTTYNFVQSVRRLFTVCWQVPFEKSTYVVLLGRVYYGCEIGDFFEDVHSRLYFCYRTGFEPLQHTPTEIRSDTGWGCTIRTGQMLLAEGLLRHVLGRTFRLEEASDNDRATLERLQQLFYDEPSPASPFSIHNLTDLAFQDFCKMPGSWYNPSMVGHVLYKAASLGLGLTHEVVVVDNNNDGNGNSSSSHQMPSELADVTIYVAQNNCVFVGDLLDQCRPPDGNGAQWRSPIILVPVRLGLDHINPTYYHCIQRLLETQYSLGFIGGRENSSYYFVGFQQDELVFLDPHYLQSGDDHSSERYHTRNAKKMRFKELSPSCLLGFYCRTKEDLAEFLSCVQSDTQGYDKASRKSFHLVDVYEGSSAKFHEQPPLKRRSLGSLEVLSLFEETIRHTTSVRR